MSVQDEKLLWTEKSRQKVCNCAIFDYYKISREGPFGEQADFTLLDAPDWVTVVALVEQNGEQSFLMVKQFRHGSGQLTVEFPAGVVEAGEDPAAAAARELLEETGYQAEELVMLGAVNPNPAFLNNTSYTFLAQKLTQVAELNLDEYEWVEPQIISVEEVQSKMGHGEYDNGIMVSAFALYLMFQNQKK